MNFDPLQDVPNNPISATTCMTAVYKLELGT